MYFWEAIFFEFMRFLFILFIIFLLIYYTRKFWAPIVFQFLFRQVEKKVKKAFDQTRNQRSQKKSEYYSSDKKKQKMKTDDLGEYIDYEEIE